MKKIKGKIKINSISNITKTKAKRKKEDLKNIEFLINSNPDSNEVSWGSVYPLEENNNTWTIPSRKIIIKINPKIMLSIIYKKSL